MRAYRLLAAIILLISLGHPIVPPAAASPAAAAPASVALSATPAMFTRQQMEADLRQLTEAARQSWAYADDKRENDDVDLDAQLADKLGRLDTLKTRDDFYYLLEEYVAALHDGHAYVNWDWPSTGLFWPLQLAGTREGIVVSFVAPPAAALGVAKGDRLVSVDGQPAEALQQRLARRLVASTPLARQSGAMSQMERIESGKAVVLDLTRPNGTAYRVTLPGISYEDFIAVRPAQPPFSLRMLDAATAHLKIDTFQPEPDKWYQVNTTEEREAILAKTKQTLHGMFAQIAPAKALVLDLRGNGGGTDMLGEFVAQHLLAAPFIYYFLQQRYSPAMPSYDKPPHTSGWGTKFPVEVEPDAGIIPFKGRLIVLHDEFSFSTTDNLLSCLKDLHPNATFIGRPSGGGTGAPREVVTLTHSGAGISLCTMKVWSPKDRLIEGRGTLPDLPVVWTQADVAQGRDPDLEAALKLLKTP